VVVQSLGANLGEASLRKPFFETRSSPASTSSNPQAGPVICWRFGLIERDLACFVARGHNYTDALASLSLNLP
jgi:hypothetical protein